MEFTAEQIQKKYESLPEDVKKAVSSVDTTDTLIDIGDKYQLHIDKMAELVDETTLVMLGLKPTSSFVTNVKSRLGISQEVAESVVKDVNEKILIKIRESLRQMSEEPKEELSLGEIKPIVEKTETVEKPLVNIDQKDNLQKTTPSFDQNTSEINPVVTKPKTVTEVKQNVVEPKSVIDTPQTQMGEQEVLKKEDILKGIEDPLGISTKDLKEDSMVGKKTDTNSFFNENKETEVKKEKDLETKPSGSFTIEQKPTENNSVINPQEKTITSDEKTNKESTTISVQESVITPKKELETKTNNILSGEGQNEASILEQKTPTNPTSQTPDIIENKLTQVVKEPVVEEKITEDEEEKPTITPAIDPYREPIE